MYLKNQHKRWSKSELQWVENNYLNCSYRKIGQKIGRSESSIRNLVIIKGWAKQKPVWSTRDVEFLKKNIKKLSIEDINKKLLRTKESIIAKYNRIKRT